MRQTSIVGATIVLRLRIGKSDHSKLDDLNLSMQIIPMNDKNSRVTNYSYMWGVRGMVYQYLLNFILLKMYDSTYKISHLTDNAAIDLQVVRLKDAAESFIAGEVNAFENAGFNEFALWFKTASISQMEILFQSITKFLINQSNKALVNSKDRLENPNICGDFLDIILEHEKFRIIERDILKKYFLDYEGRMIKSYGNMQVFTGIIILIRDNGFFKKNILDQKVTGKTIFCYVKRQYGIDISHQFYRNKELSELAFKQFPLFRKLGLSNKSNEKQ